MLTLLYLLATANPSSAADTSPASVVTTQNGVKIQADLRSEYLTGFPMLVEFAVTNGFDQAVTFPDLSARPFLVHFLMSNPAKGYRQDRANTAPEKDPGTNWSIPSRGEKRVLLEIPNAAHLDPGAWTLGVEIRDPAGTITIPSKSIQIAEPKPVAGKFFYEPFSAAAGSAMAWLHQASSGFDLYLMTFQAKNPSKVQSQSYLLHLPDRVEPLISRTRTEDSNARYVYWQSGVQSLTATRLDGMYARNQPKTVSLPYPSFELLAQGVTDGKGGLMVPIWIPGPAGASGSVKLLGLDSKGNLQLRKVTDLPSRPIKIATSLDAAGGLLMGMSHAAGVDLYRADPSWATELPARGIRVWKAEAGFMASELSWDILPDQGDQPGGIALQVLLLGEGGAKTYRRMHTDLGGKIKLDTGVLPWALPGAPVSFLSDNAGKFYAIARESEGALWFLAQGSAPTKLTAKTSGVLFLDGNIVKMRTIGGAGVVTDVEVGPR